MCRASLARRGAYTALNCCCCCSLLARFWCSLPSSSSRLLRNSACADLISLHTCGRQHCNMQCHIRGGACPCDTLCFSRLRAERKAVVIQHLLSVITKKLTVHRAKNGNQPGGLFTRAMINVSVFTHATINVSVFTHATINVSVFTCATINLSVISTYICHIISLYNFYERKIQ